MIYNEHLNLVITCSRHMILNNKWGKYYRCLNRPTLCRPNFVVISVPAWMTPAGERSDKFFKSQASAWLPAEISHTSHALLNWCASHFLFIIYQNCHPRAQVSQSQSFVSSWMYRAMFDHQSGRELQRRIFSPAAPSASPSLANTWST